jgi:hypothetical protein
VQSIFLLSILLLIVDTVNGAADSEDEGEDGSEPKIKLGDVKEQLSNLISFVQQSKYEEIVIYYDHLKHLYELIIIKEMGSKSVQMMIDSFFKPCAL